ncbi:ABC transporter substrate-binding protein [Micrococcales bacterium 31B]|nr:ABC transporter substrate-binding protein [Micrococcales bacterium 31B]
MFTPLTRRSLLATGAVAATGAALAACGPAGATDEANTSAASATTAVDFASVKPAATIEFWSSHPGGSKDVEQEIIDAFNSSQSDTKVTLVTGGKDYEEIAAKFNTAQAGGKLPGVVLLSDVWWFRYMINDQIIPVNDLVTQVGIEQADYVDALWGDYTYGDKQWAFPYARSTPLFYYNKADWAKAGLEDRAPKTWAEMAEWGPKLKAATGKVAYQNGAFAGYAGWVFQNPTWGNGGGFSNEWTITVNEQPVIDAVEYAAKAIADGWAGVTANDQADDFAAGAVSCTISSTGSLVGVLTTAGDKFEVGVGFLPGGDKATDMVCPTGGSGLGIPQAITPEEQLAAANFIKFATSPENTVKFAAATGYMPVRKSADASSITSKTPQAQVAIDQLSHTRSQDWARVFLPGGDKAIADGIGLILSQKQDAKTVLTTVKAQLEDIYTKQVKPKLA